MKGLTIINHPDFGQVRSVVIDREPWFVAKDICDVMGLTNSRKATADLDDEEKGVTIIYTPGGNQQVGIVNESGLYSLIFQSRKPTAKAFKKWVTSEVLPSIRKFGYYIDPTTALSVKERNALRREMLCEINKYITQEDVHKCAVKTRRDDLHIIRVLRGTDNDNAIMRDLQERAIANRKTWYDAYGDEKIKEVLSILK